MKKKHIYSDIPLLTEVDQLKEQIDALRPLDDEQEKRIIQKFRLDWNYHSNAIEGNALDFGETHAFIMYGLTAKGKPFKDHLDIRGHNDAINFIMALVKSEYELNESDVRNLHSILLIEPYDSNALTTEGLAIRKRINVGQYKQFPNSVLTITGEMHYYATPEDTPILMGDLMEWYKSVINDNSVHPIVIATLFHHKFVAIHPFDDGNGRMARLLMNLVLLKYNYPPVVIKHEDKKEYYFALSQADIGNPEPFIEFIAKNTITSLQLFIKGAIGESLEEPSDLDKQLALFKQEIDSQENKIELTVSPENKFQVFQSSLKPLLNKLRLMIFKFREFFIDYQEYSLQYLTVEEIEASVWNYYSVNIEDTINDHLEYRDEFYFAFILDQFKVADNLFSLEIKLVIKFSKLKYHIFAGVSSADELKNVIFSDTDFWLPKLEISNYYHKAVENAEATVYTQKIGNEIFKTMKEYKENGFFLKLSNLSQDELVNLWESFAEVSKQETSGLRFDKITYKEKTLNIYFKNGQTELDKNYNGIEVFFSKFVRNRLNMSDAVFVLFYGDLPF